MPVLRENSVLQQSYHQLATKKSKAKYWGNSFSYRQTLEPVLFEKAHEFMYNIAPED